MKWGAPDSSVVASDKTESRSDTAGLSSVSSWEVPQLFPKWTVFSCWLVPSVSEEPSLPLCLRDASVLGHGCPHRHAAHQQMRCVRQVDQAEELTPRRGCRWSVRKSPAGQGC